MDDEVPEADFVGRRALRNGELIRQTCATLDVYIMSGHVSVDHVHLSVPLQLAVRELIQRLKGRSSRLLEEFGELKRQYWGSHLVLYFSVNLFHPFWHTGFPNYICSQTFVFKKKRRDIFMSMCLVLPETLKSVDNWLGQRVH
jgi:hypothetical protein